MYEQGDLKHTEKKISKECKDRSICHNCKDKLGKRVVHGVYDSRGYNSYEDPISCDNPPIFYLPHSCNEWCVGGIKELKQLRDDINKVLKSEID